MIATQPFPYQGSKRRLAPIILHYLPDDAGRVIEPFAGSAAVSLAVAAERRDVQFMLNDLNAPLIDLWREILQRPEDLAADYQRLWEDQQGHVREFYDEVRSRFNRNRRPDLLLFLLARCVKASVRYNAAGDFNQSPDNRRLGMRPAAMRQNLLRVSSYLAGRTQLAAVDYRESLAWAEPQDLVYLDPPYQGVCWNRDPRYLAGVSFEDLVEALDNLNRRRISFVLSYDGRTGNKTHGRPLPEWLGAQCIEVNAGRSAQSTLLGGHADTYESIYLSRALLERMGHRDAEHDQPHW
jgi:DNA adenine methylase